ncbi:MAG TPA: hypothetical protein VJ044_12095, partial [Candidatus Hodarchaeales archaeon]|nr:hypothetical protein [Candidatus Hodarchaeales archaeon]
KAASTLAYQGLAYIYMKRFKEAEDLLNEAEERAEATDDTEVLLETRGIQIYLENARYNYYRGAEILQAVLNSHEKLDEGEKTSLSPWLLWARIAGAKSLLKLGKVNQALLLNQAALRAANLTNDRFFRAFALLGIGHALDLVDQVKESLKIYSKSLKLAKAVHANNLVSIIYNRVGMAMSWRLNDLNEGQSAFRKAIEYSDQGEGAWLKEGPMWNLVAAYQAKGEYSSAIETIQELAFNARLIGDSRTELIATLNLAQLLEETGDKSEAQKVRDAGESLASILGINISDFQNGDSADEEGMEEEEDDLSQEGSPEEDESEYVSLGENPDDSNVIEFNIDLGPEDDDEPKDLEEDPGSK